VTLPEKVVNSSHASDYPFKRTVPVDFSDDFEEEPTEAELRTKAQAYVTGIGVPVVSIKLSFINLADTEEYKDVAPLQSVNLCDVINVQFEKYGITTTAKIVKTVYDVLGEKYESLEIGSLRSSLATTINDQNANTQTEITTKFAKVGTEIDNATAWLTNSGGYVIAVKNTDGTWKELLFLDTNDTATAHNVLRINENGIGFSSNGVNGPYTQAWTLDGRLVIGGTNVPSITVYDSQQNIIFQASATAMIWNAGNSSMDATGVISMTGAKMNGGSIIQTDNWGGIFKLENGRISVVYNNLDVGYFEVATNSSHKAYLATDVYNAEAYIGHDLDVQVTRNVSIDANGFIQIDGNSNVNIITNDFSVNGNSGDTGSLTFVDDITYDTYTFATDLDIDLNNMYASWNNVTMGVATGHTTDTAYFHKGIKI